MIPSLYPVYFRYADFHIHFDWYHDEELHQAHRLIKNERILAIAASMDAVSYRHICEESSVNPYIIPTFGIHPARAASCPFSQQLADIDRFATESPLIGEIGLDLFWVWDTIHDAPVVPETAGCTPARQEQVLSAILDAANRLNKYCVLHTKGAEQRIYDILMDFPHVKPIIHWYSGSAAIFARMMERGWYATFSGELCTSPAVRELLQLVPAERLLAETDNPDAGPWLGLPDSSPALIRDVFSAIAKYRHTEYDQTAAVICENVSRILQDCGLCAAYL